MAMPKFEVSGRGVEVTDAINKYIQEKIKKYEKIFDVAVSIEVVITNESSSRGVDKDFKVEILMHLPKVDARVEKVGADMYAIIDEATDVLVRKIKRYKEKSREWEGKDEWKLPENVSKEEDDEGTDKPVMDYVPKIVKRKKIENCTPVSEIEAIERMEMMGYDSFLFKNSQTGKFSMIYRRKAGDYGIVEPCDE